MTENSVAGEYFEHLAEYALAVCRKCKHGVLPSQVKSHLQRAHRVKLSDNSTVEDESVQTLGQTSATRHL